MGMMIGFEYRFVAVGEESDDGLDAAGAEGWEAVGVTPGERGVIVLLKRPLLSEHGEHEPDSDEDEEERGGEEHHGRCRCGGRKHLDVVNVHVHGGCRRRHGCGK
ncbi:MAG: hypothetical protein ACP5O6_12075 [Candidatus Baltobacteraceae bacterium]